MSMSDILLNRLNKTMAEAEAKVIAEIFRPNPFLKKLCESMSPPTPEELAIYAEENEMDQLYKDIQGIVWEAPDPCETCERT